MALRFLKRRYRILLLIGIAGTLFLCFQLFSFKVISISGRQQHGNQQQARILDQDGGKDLNNKKLEFAKKKMDKKGTAAKPKERESLKVVDEQVNEDEPKITEGYQLVRGTHLHQAENYKEKNGMFQCVKSKEMIPFSQVNDDYCDCADSSDEPGTSACSDSVFFCTFQNSEEPPQHILGSRVNDGVCDCCDGSDEWVGVQVFGGVHLTDKRYKSTLTHAPCSDTCRAVQKSQEEDAKIRELGKRLKHTYLEAGKKAKDSQLYEPDGIFYQLSLTCFDYETVEYKYKFCPFKSVTQQSFPQAAIHIGKKPRWRTKLNGVYVLRMEGGDVSACPEGKQRQTVITFICGLNDRIIEVREDEKCIYGMKFSTPAAC